MKDGDTYFMWCGGNEVDRYGQQVGFATSQDGITWFKSELNPVWKGAAFQHENLQISRMFFINK